MKLDKPCFFMICTDGTEKECLDKGLFGDRDWRFPFLRTIKKGDFGFLMNVSRNQLLGIFEAVGTAQMNIDQNAWGGGFPSQIRVNLLGDLQRINDASTRLNTIIQLKEIKRHPNPYKVPPQNTYGPDITDKVLSLFRIPNQITSQDKEPEQVGSIPEYTLKDVAGLDKVKEFIYQRIAAPFEDEQTAYSLGLRIGGGMLLFGPPGTGKTLIAMSIAKDIQAKFIDISPSVIMGYPGEAEKRLENIFSTLSKEPRAVVFLDEAEWILCKRGEQSSSVMQRITPVLLAQLSRIFKEKTKPIIIIAATNKPDMIDSAFLRPGRFDKIFYLGLPHKQARSEILKIQLNNRAHNLREQDFIEIADRLEGYSGADIAHIVEEAAFIAFNRRSSNTTVQINKDDIMKVIENTPKSVTPQEVDKLTKWGKERGITV